MSEQKTDGSRRGRHLALVFGMIVLGAVSVGVAGQNKKPFTFSANTPVLADEVNSNFDALFEELDRQAALIETLVPSGTIFSYAGSKVPDGFYECNGATLLRSDDPALFEAIGTMYGGGPSFFDLPDYRGYFLRGWDHNAHLDPGAATRTDRGDGVIGDFVGTAQGDGFGRHAHHGVVQSGNQWFTVYRREGGRWPSENTFSRENTGEAGAGETRPQNKNVMFIIKR